MYNERKTFSPLKPILEIACFNFESTVIAEQGGADRIELCEDFSGGGVTPNHELFIKVKKELSIPVFVMIRPRPGNFVYTDEEFEQMKKDIRFFKEHGVNGIVFGILKEDQEIDVEKNADLVKLASPLSCTFHRAFDDVPDIGKSLEMIIKCGFLRILTSGGKSSALAGSDDISKLVEQANKRIIIIPGGGVRSKNIFEIKSKTLANEFHSSAIIKEDIADLLEVKLLNHTLAK